MTTFQLSKLGGVIDRPEGMPAPGPYYTSIVDMQAVAAFPFDYALYFSTDHHGGEGGIWLYVCDGDPTVAGNWRSYDEALAAGAFDHLATQPAANPIYHDSTQGNGHTETPHAVIVDGRVYLSYHKNGIEGTQMSLLATSDDGVAFTRIHGDADSVILRYAPGSAPGNGHTGYFRWSENPFAGVAQRYIGYSLHGGGDNYHSALWASDDAIAWTRLAVMTPQEGLALDEPDLMVIWHELDPASIRALPNDEYVAICAVGNRASGSAPRISELYEIFIAANGHTFTRLGRRILGVGPADAGDSEELSSATTIQIGDRLHLLYVGATDAGQRNTVMAATGHIDLTAPLSPAL